jgi:hypothetical protein
VGDSNKFQEPAWVRETKLLTLATMFGELYRLTALRLMPEPMITNDQPPHCFHYWYGSGQDTRIMTTACRQFYGFAFDVDSGLWL